MSIEFLSLIFVVSTLFTLPTCFIKFIFLFTNFFNFPDLSSKNMSQYNFGVIFNSALVDLMLEIISIKS